MNLVLAFLLAVALDPGLGDFHWTVTTKNAQAQAFFDQGMKYVYAFNHESAVRSFGEAARLDPKLAMAHWGMALALGPNINLDVDPDREKQAYQAMQTALKLAPHASPKERDLIAALARRYSIAPDADLRKLGVDYSRAMGLLAKKYRDDLDVMTLYAESVMDLRPWKFWSHDGKPAEGTAEILSALESVLRRNPRHLGANHYYVHAVEASSHPERATASAERLRTLAPAAGHLVHMPAHIFHRTGNYAGAAEANEHGARADRAYIAAYGGHGIYPMMYYNHNLQFGLVAYAMIGRWAEAKRMADELSSNAVVAAKEMPMLESATTTSLLLLARFGRWQEVLAAPKSDVGPLGAVLARYARGSAHAILGNVAGAESELRALEAARKDVPDDTALFQNSEQRIAEVASTLLAARIAEARGDRNAAITGYEKAAAQQDALNYNEPPDWYYPVRETLGAALLRAARPADAERAFREDLRRNPRNPRSLYGLAAALRAQKKDAAAVLAQFRKGWKGGALRAEEY
jgi:tetratricopeptide (TPR) repeat protein